MKEDFTLNNKNKIYNVLNTFRDDNDERKLNIKFINTNNLEKYLCKI